MGAGVPVPLTSLVGREEQVAEVGARLERHRLVTLTGMGGVGKTRLALAVAGRWRAGRLVWLDLNDVPAVGDLTLALAAVVCGGAQPHLPSRERLVKALTDEPALIVLDGCDRLIDAGRELVTALLQAVPGLRVLTTTRELLGVPGELTWPVPGLAADDALQLFLDRAGQVRPGFGDRATARHICARLDGLPLAIELAAARLRVLSAQQIADGLDDSLRLLGPLEATLDSSHEMLPAPEALVFRRLAVFPAGAPLEAVEAVAGDDVLNPLTRLVERSLVRVELGADARYRLPDAVRQYAAARLAENGETETVRAAMVAWCAGLVQCLDDVEPELGNLRQALAWADPLTALDLAGHLWRFGWLRGHYGEARTWTTRALAAATGLDASPEQLARARHGAGVLAYLQCDYDEALTTLTAALPGCAPGERVEVLRSLAGIARERGDYGQASAIVAWTRELALDATGTARADLAGGMTAWLRNDPVSARALAEEALKAHRRLGDAEGTAEAGLLLGLIALPDSEKSQPFLEAALTEGERLGAREIIAYARHGLGTLGDRAQLRQALAVHHDLGDRWRTASVLDDLARAALADGDAENAARLVGAADAAREAIGVPVPAVDRAARARLEHEIRMATGSAGYERAREAGAFEGLDRAVERTLSEKRAPATTTPREPVLAVRALGGSQVSLGERPVGPADWGYAKPRELLHFLLSHEPAGKDAIGVALWPEADPQSLRGAFHTTLNRLRRVIGADRVVYQRQRYSIAPGLPLSYDVAVFREALRQDRDEENLREAVRVYRGDYLAGEAFGDWATQLRDQLQRSAERALLELGGLLLRRGAAARAVPVYRRALELDPLLESAHRGLMQCQVDLGEPARALKQFEILRETLRAEVDAGPGHGTTALAHRIKTMAS